MNDMVRQECYYKVDTIGCLSHEELMDEMCRSGIARGQIELVLRTLRESMASLLLKGYSVRIDGLGRFNLSIGKEARLPVPRVQRPEGSRQGRRHPL